MMKQVVYFAGGLFLVVCSAFIKSEDPTLADNLFSVGIGLVILSIAEIRS